MNERLSRNVVTALAALTLAAGISHANLLTNGSFELGTFVDDGTGTMIVSAGPTTITGWTATGRQLAWLQSPNVWGLSAQDGNRFLDLTALNPGPPFGGVTQTIATTAGQQYELSFQLGTYTARWGGPPVSILADAGGTTGTFTVSTTSSSSTWTPFSLPFTATSTSTPITLTGAAGVNYIGLDNVSVDPAGAVGAVPEPGAGVLLSVGLAALVLFRRKSVRKRFEDAR